MLALKTSKEEPLLYVDIGSKQKIRCVAAGVRQAALRKMVRRREFAKKKTADSQRPPAGRRISQKTSAHSENQRAQREQLEQPPPRSIQADGVQLGQPNSASAGTANSNAGRAACRQ